MTMRLTALTSILLASATCLHADEIDSAASELFESKIRPVLVRECYECHSRNSDEAKGSLRLDTRDQLRAGGESGPAIVAGNANESLLLQALRHDGLEMPPDKKLPANVIADFEQWVRMGAPDPRDGEVQPPPESEAVPDWDRARQFWSYQPPRLHDPPLAGADDWPSRKHDGFILHRLAQVDLQPSPRADGRVLVRRLALDLTGLPPAASDLVRYVEDPSPRTLNQLIDKWLASPRFGERWARMWLDLSRYAEDQAHIVGNNTSLFFPNAYLFRDWVIHALNDDLAYDRFIQLQLAADLIAPDDPQQQAALGFIGLGPKYYDRGRLEVKAEEWEDRVDTVTRAMLGLTVACARCHDHKYDPLPTEDYYAVASIFASSRMFNRPLDDEIERQNDGQAKKPEEAMHVVREGQPTDLHVFIRGNVETQGEQTQRGFLRILSPDERIVFSRGSGREELARAIASDANPLTARVMVNRVWGQLMGEPIVGTPSNFGSQGQPPTHPDLLDDLAVRFMNNGWSLKWLVREIVTSSTYQQTSVASERHREIDPANTLLGHMNRRALAVESWRDNLLACSGELASRLGGPSIDPDDPSETRRTIYAHISRFKLNPMLALFDFPDANVHSAIRSETTTPLQKLFIMNHPLLVRHSELLVDRFLEQPGASAEQRVEFLYERLFGRAPTVEEQALAQAFLPSNCDDRDAWVQYTQALVASNEMLFVD